MIQPPGRIEQLNNFQDSVQSPDGLDRLRALQYIQEALPSTKAQGLMGMPQVTVPQMQPQGPMMNREDGGPVINKFGGGFFKKFIESDDVKKLFSPTVATPQVVEEPIPVPVPEDTMKVFARDEEGIRNRAIQGGVLEGQRYTPVGGGTTTAVIPEGSQTQFTFEGNQSQVQPSLTLSTPMQGQFKSKASAMAHAMANQGGGLVNVYQLGDGSWDYQRTGRSQNTFYGGGIAMKGGGQVIPKQYGGEIGTGGLVGLTADGMQIFDNSKEGALNRATHGGVLEGYNYTPSIGGTATAGEPVIQLNDPMGNAAGGVDSSYDTSHLPRSAIADTNLYNLPSVQSKGGIYNASDVRDSGMSLTRPADAPETIVNSTQQTPYRDPRTGKIPYDLYVPPAINDFGQGYDLKDMDYFTANALALNEGAQRFIYNNEYARTDPGLLSNYNYSRFGTKPYAGLEDAPHMQDDVQMPGGHYGGQSNILQDPNSSAAMRAKGYTYSGRPGVGWQFTGTEPYEPYMGRPGISRAGGGQVDPAQAAQGLASLGRYGDNMLVHMNPEEVEGLMSLGKITYNPITGLPEAWGWGSIMKTVRKLAPIALAIAAPYAFGATTALGIGASTALGSFAGNIIAGAKPKDALKSGLMSGLMAGGGAYFGGAASGFGGGTAQAGAAGTSGAVTTNMSGVPSYGGISGQVSGPVTAGRSITQAGLGNSAGYGGINKIQGPPQASQFSMADVGNAQAIGQSVPTSQPLQLAPQQGTEYFRTQPTSYGNVEQASTFTSDPTIVQPRPITTGPEMQANQVQQFNEQLKAGNFTTQGPAPQANQFASEVSPEMAKLSEAQLRGPGSTSIFAEGGLSKENLGKMGGEIYDKYSTTGGIAKLVGMDLMTPDWEANYAAEAAAKNQQLQDAGFTVETGFNGQTVIRDSSGVQMPRTLTIQQILDRALGKTPRTKMVADYRYGPSKAEGGLISLKHGGEFSGMVPGQGHGMEDNVYMPIVEKGHGSQVGTLAVSPSEYVVDSYTMAALGNGNADAGAKVMDNVVKGVRKKAYGNMRQPNEINGLSALQPMIERI